MKAVQIQGHGDYDQIKIIDAPKPQANNGNILVKVRAAGLNPADLDVLHGHLPFAKQPPVILGTEGAGIVEEGNEDYPKGTPVVIYGGLMGIVQDGTWQEYMSVPPQFLYKMPRGITMPEAAVLPLVYLTAEASLITGEFKAGMSVLVTGASGGVGHAAYQLALLQGASIVIPTVGSPEKKDQMKRYIDKLFGRPIVWSTVLGKELSIAALSEMRQTYKDVIIDLSSENFEERIQEITDGKGVDFTIEILGGEYLGRAINMAADHGTIMTVGYKAGLEATINIMPMLANQLRLRGTNVFNLPPDVMEKSIDTVFDLIREHNMRPDIDKRFKIDEVVDACKHLADNRPFGKVVLSLDE